MNYEIQFAKITNSGKLIDRFLSCQHGMFPDITKSGMGEIFSIVEILSPWHSSGQIGQMIINSFSAAYYDGESTSDLVNFEDSLKKINENLAQVTENGETEWIGKLNGMLLAIMNNSLMISPSGRVEGYLFRDGKINHLTYGLNPQNEIHPLKTFSNVVSGQLKAQDKVLVTTKGLFDHISLESVRQIITLNDPSVAAMQITKLLKKEKVKNVNLFIINLLTTEEMSSRPARDISEKVFYLDKASESAFAKIATFWQTILSPLAKVIGSKGLQAASGAAKNISVKIKRKSSTGKQGLDKKPSLEKTLSNNQDNKLGPPDKFHDEFLADSRDDILKDEEINYSPDYYVHYYQEQKNRKNQKKRFEKFRGVLRTIFTKITAFFGWIWGLYLNKEKRKYFYIILAAILILILAAVVTLKGRTNNIGNLESQKILDEAIAAQKEAKSALSSGNQDQAKEKYLLSIDKAKSIKDSTLVSRDASSLIISSYQELDRLTSTTRFSELNPLFALSDSAKGIFVASGKAYLITENDIYKANLLGGKPDKIADFPKNKGTYQSGTILDGVLYLYTNSQDLFDLDTRTDKFEQTKISSDGRWETANSLAGYVGGLYFLDGVVGQIYKHLSDEEIFQKGEDYIASTGANNVKQSVSLAVDGSIYILKNNGQVLKYQRSKLQDFSLKNLPKPQDKIREPRKIYTDSDTPSLYILDTADKRILEFDKEGVYVRQYALPDEFTKISDFAVSVKSKKIWIVNDKGLYEITI